MCEVKRSPTPLDAPGCEKWLKERKDRTLSKGDIKHYEKIVVALSETSA